MENQTALCVTKLVVSHVTKILFPSWQLQSILTKQILKARQDIEAATLKHNIRLDQVILSKV